MNRKIIPKVGIPKDQRINTGNAYPRANAICHPFQHSTPISIRSLDVLLIYLQLKTDITDEVMEEYMKNTMVITVITINRLKFIHFQSANLISFKIKIPMMKSKIKRKGTANVINDLMISLF